MINKTSIERQKLQIFLVRCARIRKVQLAITPEVDRDSLCRFSNNAVRIRWLATCDSESFSEPVGSYLLEHPD